MISGDFGFDLLIRLFSKLDTHLSSELSVSFSLLESLTTSLPSEVVVRRLAKLCVEEGMVEGGRDVKDTEAVGCFGLVDEGEGSTSQAPSV